MRQLMEEFSDLEQILTQSIVNIRNMNVVKAIGNRQKMWKKHTQGF
jgi:hypothetical protein